ncbi:kinase-like domain-containing protein [Xylaria grammica]|nr:kinase-like domain-containing protein [Xylaria grammica]
MEILRSVSSAIAARLPPPVRKQFEKKTKDGHDAPTIDVHGIAHVQEVRLLATGGYGSIWLVKLVEPLENTWPGGARGSPVSRFVLRLPFEDALLPDQITNDVAFKRLVAAKLPHIPVPHIYLYNATSQADTSYVVEEYVDYPSLDSTWTSLTPPQKETMAQKLAGIIVDLTEVRFDMIGGLNPEDFSSTPTVEGCKLFKGRGKFHRNECYQIGPYKSTKEYILSCYDREIYYYTHGTEEDIDAEAFTDVTVEEFVESLREEQESIAKSKIVDEPFVLVHGDLHARNILAKGDQIAAVIDWEFAGSYPLSETLSGGDFEVVEAETDGLYMENVVWARKIREFVRAEVTKRGWDQKSIEDLMGDGNPELGQARMEMFPF